MGLEQAELATLIDKAKSGEDQAFAAISADFRPLIDKLIREMKWAPRTEREDIWPLAIAVLYKAVKAYDGCSAAFVTYAYRSVKNRLINEANSAFRPKRAALGFAVALSEEEHREKACPSAAKTITEVIERQALHDEINDRIAAAKPSAKERLVTAAIIADPLATKTELSEATGLTIPRITKLISTFRAKAALAEAAK